MNTWFSKQNVNYWQLASTQSEWDNWGTHTSQTNTAFQWFLSQSHTNLRLLCYSICPLQQQGLTQYQSIPARHKNWTKTCEKRTMVRITCCYTTLYIYLQEHTKINQKLTVGSPLRSSPTTTPSLESRNSSASLTVCLATAGPSLLFIAINSLGQKCIKLLN